MRRSARILELLAEQGMGQTLLAVPRESDIPPALTQLTRWSIASGWCSTDDGVRGGGMSPAKKKPSSIGDVLASVLKDTGLAARVEQAGIIPEWPTLVGTQIAAVTKPKSITRGRHAVRGVTTNAWMNELSLMEPELLRALNAKDGRVPVKRIRWLLRRA